VREEENKKKLNGRRRGRVREKENKKKHGRRRLRVREEENKKKLKWEWERESERDGE
jgi:hypothetical protein